MWIYGHLDWDIPSIQAVVVTGEEVLVLSGCTTTDLCVHRSSPSLRLCWSYNVQADQPAGSSHIKADASKTRKYSCLASNQQGNGQTSQAG